MTGSENGWLEAAIAWEVCASLHRQYCKGKDALFTTRQSDFVKHAEDARDRASHGQAPAGATILFEHEDGRYAVNQDTVGDPAWHRLGPVDISALATPAQSGLTDAYAGAREDLSIWKTRALEAEALNHRFIADINGPTFVGEPAYSDSALLAREMYKSQDDSLPLCASDLQHSAIYDNHVEMQSCMRAVAERITDLAAGPLPAPTADSVLEDAARYRWLRERSSTMFVNISINGEGAEIAATLDSAVDAARKQGANHG